jgi:hypothetical protein
LIQPGVDRLEITKRIADELPTCGNGLGKQITQWKRGDATRTYQQVGYMHSGF